MSAEIKRSAYFELTERSENLYKAINSEIREIVYESNLYFFKDAWQRADQCGLSAEEILDAVRIGAEKAKESY